MILKKLKRIGCGCFIILLILVVLGFIFSGVIIRKIISGAISQKTGVQVDVNNLTSGKLTYTDPKTGATVSINENKIPDGFPKDLPIYPGANITSSWSSNNFELTLTTKDDINTVSAFYQNSLKANGWTSQVTQTNNYLVSKGNLTGFLAFTNSNNITSILIVIGEVKN